MEEAASGLVFELATKYRALKEHKEELEESLKVINAAMADAERDLANEMVNGELQSIDFGGKLFYLYPEVRVSLKAGMSDTAFDWLRDRGLGTLIKETVNANTLTSEVKKYLSQFDNAPDEQLLERKGIEEFSTIFERTRVGLKGRK